MARKHIAWVLAPLFCGVIVLAGFYMLRHSFASGTHATFVHVCGTRLCLGDQAFFVKGANFAGGSYLASYPKDSGGDERMDIWEIYHDFNAQALSTELLSLKSGLGINAIRIFTPNDWDFNRAVQYQGWAPWFTTDGSINPLYLRELRTLVDEAGRDGMRVQISLLLNFSRQVMLKDGPIAPGSDRENFYETYVKSVASAFADDPAVLSWEVDQEGLVDGTANPYNNYRKPSGYEANALGFDARMIRAIRSVDKNHLITSGEGVAVASASSTWHWPTADFAALPDVDGVNGGTPFSYYSIVDYLSPHVYVPQNEILAALTAIRQRSTKPVVIGEVGYRDRTPTETTLIQDPHAFQEDQNAYMETVVGAIKRLGTAGLLLWDPEPLLPLMPGSFHIVPAGNEGTLIVDKPRKRTIFGFNNANVFWLFNWDGKPLPAASTFKNFTP